MAGLAAGLEDDEREVHDDVGALDQRVDRGAVEHVARRYSVRFQPCAAGSNGRRAMPTIRPTSRERSSARMKGRPISPVGPVTATVRPAISPSVGVQGADDPVGRRTEDAVVLVEVAEHVEAVPVGRMGAEAGQAGLDGRPDRVGVDAHEARI